MDKTKQVYNGTNFIQDSAKKKSRQIKKKGIGKKYFS